MNPDNSRIKILVKTAIKAGLFALLASLLVACSENSPTITSVSIGDSFEEVNSAAAVVANVELVPMEFLDWDIEMSNIGGQIVVMDFWATWCVPCIERFPAMVELSNHYSRDEVRFISVNIDDHTDEDAYISALDFLTIVGADFENYQLQHDMFDVFNFFGLQSIPAVTIYNTAGEEHVRLDGMDPTNQFDESDIVAAIEELIASPLVIEEI